LHPQTFVPCHFGSELVSCTLKLQQLNELRCHEWVGTLAAEERSILDHLLNELEQDEWEHRRPALARQENLLAHGRAQLAGLQAEHEVLKANTNISLGNR